MRILALLFPRFTAIDLIGPANCWGLIPGVQFQFAAAQAGALPMDFGGPQADIVATHDFTTCWQDPDVLLVPGGGRAAFEALDDDLYLDAIARIGANAGWVTSVCNGSLLLGAAGLLKGYKAACYWYSRDGLALFDAEPVNERVVIDRNRATGGGMTAGVDFGLHMIGQWAGESNGALTELLMEYAPQPPFGSGRPELASPDTLATARGILQTEMPNERAAQAARRRGFAQPRA
ncbi:DJ-1/PfpI family protein [Variovorax boronicumulans]